MDDKKKSKKKKALLQYHPAFVSAAELELSADREKLEFTEEYKLNSKARMIDFLVIKKKSDERLESGLAQIFKKINIMILGSKGTKSESSLLA